MRWRKYIEHYYRFRLPYSHYRECVRQHYTNARLTNRRNRIPCEAMLQSRGYTNCFACSNGPQLFPSPTSHLRPSVGIRVLTK
ncbi:hypothetical protein [Pontibacter ruber]|uniref:Uncharacterized protein n=1 Tax=Pontibacter ruber TaxID=1343895 RepID=A0ABW5CV35_9BACT|nr:hypothetical protein [Pontibacter ruber]